jgi:hypothetical protein
MKRMACKWFLFVGWLFPRKETHSQQDDLWRNEDTTTTKIITYLWRTGTGGVAQQNQRKREQKTEQTRRNFSGLRKERRLFDRLAPFFAASPHPPRRFVYTILRPTTTTTIIDFPPLYISFVKFGLFKKKRRKDKRVVFCLVSFFFFVGLFLFLLRPFLDCLLGPQVLESFVLDVCQCCGRELFLLENRGGFAL